MGEYCYYVVPILIGKFNNKYHEEIISEKWKAKYRKFLLLKFLFT